MSYHRKRRYHYREEKRAQIVFSDKPLSLQAPLSVDKENDKYLKNVLGAAGRLEETSARAKQREYVLRDLLQICQEWVTASARKHNHPEEFVSNSKVRLFAFGSYKLNVHSLGDDVDLLCVGPNFLTRDMFFDELGSILQENACIEHFYAVRNAYVPVMSFKYNNVDIDMVYAQLQIELLDNSWDINDDRNLRNLDNTSILSLNGVRLAQKTLELVPKKDVFRLALRAIRYWAKQRGIYSNKLGYLGGVSWAILVARVCQLYPQANASMIVQNFFLFYHIWNFGTPLKAITLCNIVQHDDMPSIKVWDPNDQQTKYELMHIITPAFPAMNSTHNVSISTFEVLKREIARAFHLLSRAERHISEEKWKDLFDTNTFFIDHKSYIFIKACAPYKNLTEWSGLIESKIRSFVSSLEQHPNVKVTPFCKAIKLKLTRKEINECMHPDVLRELKIKKKQRLKQQKLEKLKKKREDAQRQRLRQIQLDLQRERMEKRENERLQKEMDLKKEEANAIKVETSPETGESVNDVNVSNNQETKPVKKTEESTQISINDGQNNGADEDDDDVMLISNLSVPVPASVNIEEKEKKKSVSPKAASTNPYVYVNSKYRKTAKSASPSIEEQKNSKDEDKDVSVSVTKKRSASFSGASPSVTPWGDCAHRVTKKQITCCQSMSNKILREKAEKFEYGCKCFVVGLKVTKRAIAVSYIGGKQIDTITRFDFSRSVFGFLKGLNHIYTDSHLIIELLPSTKVPHFLFPQYEYRRPSKEHIERHHEVMAVKYEQWKSKSCIATMDAEKQKELSASPIESHSATTSPSKAPQFDADDILMNDDDDIGLEAMPGLAVAAKKEPAPSDQTILNESKINEKENDRKRSADEMENNDGPSAKKRKLSVEEDENKKEEINYLNPYFKEISFDQKYDNSPTFEYATKLYRKSQNFVSWEAVSHDLTATATYVVNTCNDKAWKNKLKKILANEKYGWNGFEYKVLLSKKLMHDLAYDIAYNYINHKNEKKRKRKYQL